MRILNLLKEIGKDFVKGVRYGFNLKELVLCIFTIIVTLLFIVVIAVIPAIILHYIWLTNIEIDDLSFALLLSELLLLIVVNSILDFIKYIKRKWNEVK